MLVWRGRDIARAHSGTGHESMSDRSAKLAIAIVVLALVVILVIAATGVLSNVCPCGGGA